MNGERLKEKRLHEGGVGPAMRSPAGLALPQRETLLSGRRAGDAIAGGIKPDILHADWAFVKRSSRQRVGWGDAGTPTQAIARQLTGYPEMLGFIPHPNLRLLSIGEDKLRANQLPDSIVKPDGFMLQRPATWR